MLADWASRYFSGNLGGPVCVQMGPFLVANRSQGWAEFWIKPSPQEEEVKNGAESETSIAAIRFQNGVSSSNADRFPTMCLKF